MPEVATPTIIVYIAMGMLAGFAHGIHSKLDLWSGVCEFMIHVIISVEQSTVVIRCFQRHITPGSD